MPAEALVSFRSYLVWFDLRHSAFIRGTLPFSCFSQNLISCSRRIGLLCARISQIQA